MYVGSQTITLDNKNRFGVPHMFRRKFNEDRDGRFLYIVPGREPKTLALYHENTYARLRAAEPDNESLSDDAYDFRMFESGNTLIVDPDDQGRFVLPQALLDRLGLGRELILVGMGDHLVIWGREDYDEFTRRMWPQVREKRAAVREEMRVKAAQRNGASRTVAEETAEHG